MSCNISNCRCAVYTWELKNTKFATSTFRLLIIQLLLFDIRIRLYYKWENQKYIKAVSWALSRIEMISPADRSLQPSVLNTHRNNFKICSGQCSAYWIYGEKMALRQVFLQILRFSRVNIVQTLFHFHSLVTQEIYNGLINCPVPQRNSLTSWQQ